MKVVASLVSYVRIVKNENEKEITRIYTAYARVHLPTYNIYLYTSTYSTCVYVTTFDHLNIWPIDNLWAYLPYYTNVFCTYYVHTMLRLRSKVVDSSSKKGAVTWRGAGTGAARRDAARPNAARSRTCCYFAGGNSRLVSGPIAIITWLSIKTAFHVRSSFSLQLALAIHLYTQYRATFYLNETLYLYVDGLTNQQ